jgi:hypothetical protein
MISSVEAAEQKYNILTQRIQQEYVELFDTEVRLSTLILDMLGSNLDCDTGYPGSNFSWISSFPSGENLDNSSIRLGSLPSKPLLIHLSTIHST